MQCRFPGHECLTMFCQFQISSFRAQLHMDATVATTKTVGASNCSRLTEYCDKMSRFFSLFFLVYGKQSFTQ